MNRGVIAYMREGNRCAKNTFKNFGNILKFYFLELVSLFGSLFIFPIPMMTLARMRVARLAERDEDIQIFKSFEKSDSAKHFWTIFSYYFMKFILFLAGIVFITLLAGIFGGIGLLIGGVGKPGYIVGCILAAPFAIVLVLFIIIYPFMLMPGIYLYDCNTNLGLSGMFYNSIDAMRKTGKWTTFMTSFLYALRHLLWLVLIGGSTALLVLYFDQPAIRVISAIALLAFLVLYFFRCARLLLGRRVARVLLLNDICSTEKYVSLNPSTEENTPKNIYGVSKRTLRAAKKEQLLLGLFTNGPKLKDPEGVDQSKLPNEVASEDTLEVEEEDVLAQPKPENVVEIEDNKNPDPEQPAPVYENTRQIVVSTDPEYPTNMKVSKINNAESRFTGTAIALFGKIVLSILLIIISLGFATPWVICMLLRWITGNTYVNGKRLRFDGRGGGLFGKYILWTFLTIITFGIYGFWNALNMTKWITKHIHISDEHGESKLNTNVWAFTGRGLLTGLIIFFSFGFATPWALCMYLRWITKRVTIDGRELRFNGNGGSIFGKYILWSFLTIITFGIFSYSFIVRMVKWIVKNLAFVNVERNMTNIEEVKAKAAETYSKPMPEFHESHRYYKPTEEAIANEEGEDILVEQQEAAVDDLEQLLNDVFEASNDNIAEELVVEEVQEVVVEPVDEEVQEEASEPVVEEVQEEASEPVVEEAQEVVSEPAVEEIQEEVSEPAVEEIQEEASEPAEENSSNSIDDLLSRLSKLQSNNEEKPKAKRGRKKATDN